MSKPYIFLFSLVLLLFACLYGILCFYSSLASDDYYFISDVRNRRIISSTLTQYNSWCGRFTGIFLMNVFYKYFGLKQSYYILLPVLSFLFLTGGLHYFLNNLLKQYNTSIPGFEKWILVLSFTALLFFLSFDIAESWFWYCGLGAHLFSIIAFTWGSALLLDTRKPIITTVAAALCFFYVGGASEVYSVIFGIVLTLLLIYNTPKNKHFVSTPFTKKLFIIYIMLGFSFIIFLIAPGNYLRDNLFPERHILNSSFIALKSIVKFFIFYLPFKIAYIIAFSSPFLIAGIRLKTILTLPELSFKHFFYRITFFFGFLFLIFFLIVTYVMIETPPARLSFLISFLLSVYCVIIFFYAGYKSVLNTKHVNLLNYASIGIGLFLTVYAIITQFPIAKNYSAANKARIDYITTLNKIIQRDTLIILPKLPESGMIYSAEISVDTNHFTNQQLRMGYGLKFQVAVK